MGFFEQVDERLLGLKSSKIWQREKEHITTGVSAGVHVAPIVFQKGKGVFWSIEIVKNNKTKQLAQEEGIELYKECICNGLLLRSPSPVVKFSSALNTPTELLQEGLDIFDKSLSTIEQKFG